MNQKYLLAEKSYTQPLADRDIQSQTFTSDLLANTHIQAGLKECVRSSYAETEACCAGKARVPGPVEGPSGQGLYYCYVDDGTGDWD